jgi:hypothetical protein
MRKLTTEQWVSKASAKHGSKFDYSKSVYVNSSIKVIISCPEHGDFEQLPSQHLIYGCAACAGMKKFSTEQWIKKCKEVHGDKYDYSKVIYKNARTKVIIVCLEHGEFEQSPDSHKRGFGCRKCARQHKPTTEEFIRQAKDVHGNTYQYLKTVYTSTHKRVIITCATHGDFNQIASTHLQGSGCIKCSGRHLNSAEWIINARIVHGEKYDYSKTVYVGGKSKVTITCHEHGDFKQSPDHHLQGQGCNRCGKKDNDVVYLWRLAGTYHDGIPVYKIGVTSFRLDDSRLNIVADKSGHKIGSVYKYFVDGKASHFETKLLKFGIKPDLGYFDGSSECRALTELELVNILTMLDSHEQLTSLKIR